VGLKVLKFDGAIAPRVLKFDSGSAAEGSGAGGAVGIGIGTWAVLSSIPEG
jgi:hypothetical protein